MSYGGGRNPIADDDEDLDDDEDDEEKNDAIRRRMADMTEDQKHAFNLFRSPVCRPPIKRIKEIMQHATPSETVIQNNAAFIAMHAARLFAANVVEEARRLSGNNNPITPDLIMIAFSELEEHGKIPGKGPGTKRRLAR